MTDQAAAGAPPPASTPRVQTLSPFVPSAQTTSTVFRLARAVASSHIDGLDDHDEDDDDDRDNSDTDDDYNDDSDNDSDADSMKDGDEPLPEHDNHQENSSTSQTPQNSQSTTQFSPGNAPLAPALASAIKNTPDAGTPRYKLVPEKIDPSKPSTSKSASESEQTKSSKPSAQAEASISGVKGTPALPATKINAVPDAVKAKETSTPTGMSRNKPITSLTVKNARAPSSAGSITSSPESRLSAQSEAGPSVSTNTTAAIAAASAAPPPPPKAKIDPLAPTPAAPYGYKIVKVKKADGTFAKVKRPLKEDEQAVTPRVESTVNKTTEKKSTAGKPAGTTAVSTGASTQSGTQSSQPSSKGVRDTEKSTVSAGSPASNEFTTKSKGSPEKAEGLKKEEILESLLANPAQQADVKHALAVARFVKISIWSVGIIFPLFFLALGITTAVLSKHRVSAKYLSATSTKGSKAGYTDPLSQAITVAASVWPIVFAAVVAQSLKMYAAYKVERGVKLMTLEQLTSSHSVGGALKQPFLLRTFNWTTALLLFIWALSPLAGQAILRMVKVTPDTSIHNTTVSYLSLSTLASHDVGGVEGPTAALDSKLNCWVNSDGQAAVPEFFLVARSILISLMQGYSKGIYADEDIYGNVKIPRISVNGSADDGYFSSLSGFPFWIYNTSKDNQQYGYQLTQFNMTSRYFDLNCTDPKFIAPDADILRQRNLYPQPQRGLAISALNNTNASFNEPMFFNGTTYIPVGSVNATNTTQVGYGNITTVTSYMQPGPAGVLYFASGPSSFYNQSSQTQYLGDVMYSECAYRPVKITSLVACYGTAQEAQCAVQNSTEIPIPADDVSNLPLGYFFPRALSQMPEGVHATQLELFINDTQYGAHANNEYFANSSDMYRTLTGKQLSTRLGLAVNAFWTVALQTAAFTGPDYQSWINKDWQYANVTGSATSPQYGQYTVYWPWLGVLIACSVILTISAIAAAIWETMTVGPDFLGFINTSVKKSVKMPKGMSTMNARDRLAALQECEVILHDTKPDAAVGKIALGVREDGHTRLTKGRQYR